MDTSMILEHFYKVDPILANASERYSEIITPISQKHSGNYLADLCESIVSQQLSVKAASTIWARTHAVVNDWNDPSQILSATPEDLRACGLSGQKISYVKNIAEATLSRALHINALDEMSDSDIIEELTKIKGIGKWTAEMFLIFSLARNDVFSSGDLGLRNGIARLYDIPVPTPTEADELSRKWSPYRSYASRILWKTLDNEPIS